MEIFFISLFVGFVFTYIYTETYYNIRSKRIDRNYEIRVHICRNHFEDYLKLPSTEEMLSIRHIFKTDVKSWLKYTANK